MPVSPIPAGYHSLSPYLFAENAVQYVDFLKAAFGATENHRLAAPDGTIMHAELRIGDSNMMLSEARNEWKPTYSTLYLYVDDCDATFARALAAGATSIMAPANQFYGDRQGGLKDPAGNLWWVATHIEDVPPDEMARRQQEFAANMKKG